MIALRCAAFGIGLAVLAATAHVTIAYNGGYTAPGAILTMAIALGVAVAALAIGAAWSCGSRFVAGWLMLAILAGEAFGFLMTAERLVAARERAEAPLRAAQQDRAEKAERVKGATAAIASLPGTSQRLEVALEAKRAADAAILGNSSAPSCAQNCRLLLQSQADTAQAEIDAARAEIESSRLKAENELRDARAGFADDKGEISATPLADRTGIPAWVLDLIAAGLGSIAANGLGVGLIAFASHGRPGEPPRPALAHVALLASDATRALPRPGGEQRKRVVRISEHAAQFAVESLTPATGDGVDLLEIHRVYDGWCNAKGVEPLPASKIGGALSKLFEGAGIQIAERDGRRVALGVAVKAAGGLLRP